MTEKDIEPPAVPASAPGRWDWRPKVRWFVAEIVVVVSGVLIALAANAWVGERAARAEERTVLRSLRADFETNRGRLDSLDLFNERVLESGQAILSLLGAEPPATDPSRIDSLISVLVEWDAYEPVTGRLDALLSSGQIGLVQNDRLQAALAAWGTVLADVRENEQIVVDMHYDHVAPYLWEHVQVRTLGYGAGYARVAGPSVFQHDHRGMLSDPQFEDLVVERMFNVEAMMADGRDARHAIDEILGLIETELGD